ncbi:hypothetical protein ACP70R_033676 [Stipagrostis hirtigluma subsp. patula]
MSDLVKRKFDVLAPNGSNYLAWSLDAEILLASKDPLKTIKPKDDKDKTTPAEQAMALHILRHHLSATLKNEYMTERNPKVLWDLLHERFEKIETVLLPCMKREWANLRFQDFKTVEDYNTVLYGITTPMKLCGLKLEDKDLIEKTLSTFHPKLTHICRQYKKDNYKKYVNLSNAMQQDQWEDETIMQNHLSRPTGSVATPEANVTSFKEKKENKEKGPQKDSKEMAPKANHFKKKEWKSKKKTSQGPKYGEEDQECYKCRMRGHWSRICKTPKHIVQMYQELQGKLKRKHEANYLESSKQDGESSKSQDDKMLEASEPEEKTSSKIEEELPPPPEVELPAITEEKVGSEIEDDFAKACGLDESLMDEDVHGDSV